MTPDQFEIFLERNEKSTAEAIERTVNGKIRTLTSLVEAHNVKHEADMVEVKGYMQKTDAHITQTKPIIEAFNGVSTIGNLTKWLGGIVLTVAAIWALFFKS